MDNKEYKQELTNIKNRINVLLVAYDVVSDDVDGLVNTANDSIIDALGKMEVTA